MAGSTEPFSGSQLGLHPRTHLEQVKNEGIYYTPTPITTPMANSLVEALFAPLVDRIVDLLAPDRHDFAAAEPLLRRLYQIRVVDMAGDSGGFQAKVLRAIWKQSASRPN
jgi:hypothetical protein